MSNLPTTWRSTSLEVVGVIKTGNTPSTKNSKFYGGEIPFVKPSDLDKQAYIKTTEQYLTAEGAMQSRLLRPGAVLVSCIGNLGKTGIAGVHLATNQQINSVEFHSSVVDDRYGYYVCKTLKPWMEKEASATTISILNKGRFSTAPFPLAPLAEQKRIADKLDAVLARVDVCRARLNRVPRILNRFRQSVLAAAVSGQLTADWRSNQPISVSSALGEVAKKESQRAGCLRVRGTTAKLDADFLIEIPKTWAWISNYRLAEDSTNAICAGPFGTIFKAKDFRDAGVPIIFLRHVGEGKYLTHKPGFMDEVVWQEHHQSYSVFGGELLVTKLGEPPGTACIYPKGLGVAMVTPDVMKMNVDIDVAHPAYLMHFFNSPLSKKIAAELAFGVTRLRIDLSMFKTFPIPLPPISEQHEIVRRIETLFAFAERVEARLATARDTTDRLTPALLAKAFRGELVPQDPNDEPAAELLKRLAAAREPVIKGKRSGKPANTVAEKA